MSEQHFQMDNQQAMMDSGQVYPEVERPKQKQMFNIYTVMLLISFIALTLGSILMFVELQRYGNFPGEFPWKTTEGQVSSRPAN